MEIQRNTRSHDMVAYAIAAVLIFFIAFGGVSKGAGLLKPTNGNESDVFIKSHYLSTPINDIVTLIQ